ncbi:MAG: pantoate--beta-alanine ligase [Rubrobacter sp.]|nr:pantoate--beta-alanine ligase [Rubrobacter sp.]
MVDEALVARTPDEIRALSYEWRAAGKTVGLVPTMGALHEGHLSLVRKARSECGKVIVSVFVNPTQFGAGEDFDTYPRNLENDRELLSEAGCDAIFAPGVAEMYGEGSTDLSSGERTFVEAGRLGDVFEGKDRPGHFRGVATVVAMLMGAAVPHRAYFGEKDFQQLKVIGRMARELHMGVEIVGCPTVRESDGLAMSSRNANLGSEEREAATVLHRSLEAGAKLAADGEKDVSTILRRMRGVLDGEPLVEPKYVAVVDAETLEALESLGERSARILIAARVGSVRLIDNIALPFVRSE